MDFQGLWFRNGMWPLWVALAVVIGAHVIQRWLGRRADGAVTTPLSAFASEPNRAFEPRLPQRHGEKVAGAPASAPINSPFRWPGAADWVLGFAFGYLLLHPVAMEVVRWLGPGAVAGASGSPPTLATLTHAFTSVFRPDMIPMGLIFGGLSGLLAGVYGAYRSALGAQRDRLARQLDLTERYRLDLEQALDRVGAQNARLAELEQARRRTTRFMVHDFKTHLGCIIGFSELLMRAPADSLTSGHRDAVKRIHRQGRRMLNAVTDLLDLARLQEAPQLTRRAVSPADLLREAADGLALPVELNRITVGPSHRGCPPVLGDRRLLVRVLSNLAANAVKHNPPGTRAVLDAERDTEAGHVLFSCRDDGLGIPANLLGTVFGEFRGGESSEASTGVGLAFCKAAVEANGGRIWCEAAEGRGASFYFTVPVAEAADAARPSPRRQGSARESTAPEPCCVAEKGDVAVTVSADGEETRRSR